MNKKYILRTKENVPYRTVPVGTFRSGYWPLLTLAFWKNTQEENKSAGNRKHKKVQYLDEIFKCAFCHFFWDKNTDNFNKKKGKIRQT